MYVGSSMAGITNPYRILAVTLSNILRNKEKTVGLN